VAGDPDGGRVPPAPTAASVHAVENPAPTPAVHDAGGLAERLARLVVTAGPSAQVPGGGPPAAPSVRTTGDAPEGAAALAAAADSIGATVERADANARERDELLAAGLLDLQEQLGAARDAIAGLTEVAELPAEVRTQIAEALADPLGDLERQISALALAQHEALTEITESLHEVRTTVAALGAQLESLDDIEQRIGARIDEGIFALAQTVLAER